MGFIAMRQKIILAFLCSFSLLTIAVADEAAINSVPDAATAEAEKNFFTDALVQDGVKRGLDKSPELAERVEQFRKDQLAHMALEAATDEGMPDFTARAQELYQARLEKQYDLPLRLRVRVLEMNVPEGKEAEIRAQLEDIRSQVTSGKLEFQTAVMEHSQAGDLRLAQGDSYWFRKGQKSDAFFTSAESLSADKPLGEVFIDGNKAYLLGFLERKEAEVRSFDDVKAEIIAELQQEYRKDRQAVLLDSLREQYKQESGTTANAEAGLAHNEIK